MLCSARDRIKLSVGAETSMNLISDMTGFELALFLPFRFFTTHADPLVFIDVLWQSSAVIDSKYYERRPISSEIELFGILYLDIN